MKRGSLVAIFSTRPLPNICAREYKAMVELEQRRLRSIGQGLDRTHGLIIPVIFRGEKTLPAEIKDQRLCYDFADPRLGRFMTTDPLGGGVADPQSLNRYAYVLNDPLQFVDPSGLCLPGIDICIPSVPACVTFSCVSVGGGGGFGGGGNGGVVCSFAAAISIQGHAYLTKSCGNTQGGGGGGGGGGGARSPQSPKPSLLDCTINISNKITISNAIAHIPGLGSHLQEGSWGRTALDILGGGNAVAGLLSVGRTIFGNSASGTELAQTGASIMADPSMGLNPAIRAAGGQGIPSALEAVESGGGALTDAAAEGATGIGLIKLGVDALTTLGSFGYCAFTSH
jgi:RHS repeat-associated protein